MRRIWLARGCRVVGRDNCLLASLAILTGLDYWSGLLRWDVERELLAKEVVVVLAKSQRELLVYVAVLVLGLLVQMGHLEDVCKAVSRPG